MKLLRLKVEQLRQFREPVEIADLEPGINLFVGPNESGKSTLVRAIRAAFFERHKSSGVSDLQPWGDSSATPSVELEFEWQEKRWKVIKNFLKKPRCDISVDGSDYSGDEAEEKLAELLGFEANKRGASKPEHWGIPGLLWIEQGAGQEIKAPVEHAGQHLKSALGGSLGEVTSSGGDELINQVMADRGKLLTSTGRPTADYAKVLTEHDELERQQAELQNQILKYRQQVDRLGQLREVLAKDEAERIWESYRQQAKAAELKLNEVVGWQRDQQRDQQALGDYKTNSDTSLELLNRFAAQQKELQEREAQQQAAEQKLTDHEARRPAIDAALADARTAFEAARAAVVLARQLQQRNDLARELEQADTGLASLDSALARAKSLHTQLLEQRQKLQAVQVDSNTVKRLKKVAEELNNLNIRQESVATRLQFDLSNDQAVTLAGEQLAGKGERLLLEPGEVEISGIGILRISPGGEDVAGMARSRQVLLDEQASLHVQLGVTSLAEAEERQEQGRSLEEAIKRDESLLDSLAAEGLDELSSRRQLKQSRKEELSNQIQALPESEQSSLSLANAEAQQEGAAATLKAAESAESEFRSNLLLIKQSLETAKTERDKLNKVLQAPDRKQREKQAQDQLLELRANAKRLEQVIAERQKQIDQANPDILKQDVERLTRSADAAEKEAGQRRLELERIKASLEVLGAESLEEKSAELAIDLERLSRRKNELTRRADALDLLLTRLTDHRLQLTRQLQAPLQKHLNHYLQLLFPEAALTVDEKLIPEVLVRQGHSGEERGQFDELSFGAREQMGLISRLAYADLLQEAGRPTFIILDDALVHSDAERLKKMKRVLFDAAQRHQILLFSCHPDNWKDLGVVARDVQGLKG